MPLDQYREANRANWDDRARIHFESDLYGIARYVADPDHLSSIVRFDRERMPDVSGKSLLHLQCHIGTDTLSWGRLGAHVTGSDFSENSIAAARRLSEQSGTPGRFVVAELYDTPQVLPEQFDLVYTGVGAIGWLPDISGWGEVVAKMLKPGGRFYIREGHPVMWAADWENTQSVTLKHPYFEHSEPMVWDEEGTYAGDGVVEHTRTYDWNHGMAEVLNALLDHGLRIDRVEEYDFCEWQGLEMMVEAEDGRWRLPDSVPPAPMMWSILATKE